MYVLIMKELTVPLLLLWGIRLTRTELFETQKCVGQYVCARLSVRACTLASVSASEVIWTVVFVDGHPSTTDVA
jgi:hypothetical protein